MSGVKHLYNLPDDFVAGERFAVAMQRPNQIRQNVLRLALHNLRCDRR